MAYVKFSGGMTAASNSAPTGHFCSATTEAGGNPASKMFDDLDTGDDANNYWWSSDGSGSQNSPQNIRRQTPDSYVCTKYAITTMDLDHTYYPSEWTMGVGTDGTSWDTKDTQSGITMAAYTTYEYEIENSSSCNWHRINVTKTSSAGVTNHTMALSEISYYRTATPGLWTGATDNDWHTATNWDDGNVPDETVDVVINGDAPDDVELSDTAEFKSLTMTGFTGALITNDNSILASGDITLAAGMTITGLFNPNFVEFATASLNTAGHEIENLSVGGAEDPGGALTLASDVLITGGIAVSGGSSELHFATFDLTLGEGDTGDVWTFEIEAGVTITFGAGASIICVTPQNNDCHIQEVPTDTLPPIVVNGGGDLSGTLLIEDGPLVCQSLTLNSSIISVVEVDITTIAGFSLLDGSIVGTGGQTITVGGNFLSTGVDLPGGDWDVAGTAVAADATITGCDFLDTELDATDNCTDGTGNTNVNFGSATVVDVTTAKADATYGAGEVIDITVEFSESVDVTGTPRILMDVGATRYATYLSGTGSDTLTFRYTVVTADTSADLDYDGTDALALNGGTILATVGALAADLTLPAPAGAGSISDNKAIVIDAVLPVVSDVATAKANGSYTTGEVIDIVATFSKAVDVTGTPRLSMNVGVTAYATYLSGTGTTALTFRYTVVSGHNAADLDYVDVNALTLNGGTILAVLDDGVATLTLPTPGAAGSISDNKAIVIDTTTTTVVDITSAHANGVVTTDEVIDITVEFSELVNKTGTPRLLVELRNGNRYVDYQSGTGSDTLTFRMTVLSTDSTNKLKVLSIDLNGGTIKDAALNVANLTIAAPGLAGSFDYNKDISIDVSTTYQPKQHARGAGQLR